MQEAWRKEERGGSVRYSGRVVVYGWRGAGKVWRAWDGGGDTCWELIVMVAGVVIVVVGVGEGGGGGGGGGGVIYS